MQLRISVRIAVGVVMLLAGQRSYAEPAVTYTGTVIAGNEGGEPGGVRGWVFHVSSPAGAWVTHLGVYDRGGDGLAEAHPVGIWDVAGTMVASGTVPAGTAAPLDVAGRFRLVDIPNVHLLQSANYTIGAFYSHLVDGFDSQVSGLATHPSIVYADKRFRLGVSSLVMPTTPFGEQPGYFGPSFEIGVPEPGSLALVVLGMCGLVTVGQRRRLG